MRRARLLAVPRDSAAAHLGLLVEAAVERHGAVPLWLDRPLDVAPELGLELDYQRFADLIVEASGWLHAAGLRPGEHVAIIKRDSMDVLALAAGAARLGAVPALLAPRLGAATMETLLGRLGTPLVVADRNAVEACRLHDTAGPLVVIDGPATGAIALDDLRGGTAPPVVKRGPDEPAALTHTSGTTGVPKLCLHTARSLAGQARMQVIAGRLLMGRRDVVATCLTTAHARALSGWPALLAVGCAHLAMVDPDPRSAGALLAQRPPTLVETFPNVFIRWEHLADDARGPLANVRIFLSTFDAAHPRTIQRLLAASRRRLPLYIQAYAQSEVGGATISVRRRRRGPPGDARDVGWAVPGLSRVRIVDPASGERRRRGEVGLVEVASVGQFAGYLGEEERTRTQVRGQWWDMGDLGVRTRLGSLRLLGRQVDAVPGLEDALALEDMILELLPELTELVILGLDEGPATPVVCTRDDTSLDPLRWREATAGMPPLAKPLQRRWDELPTTATWKVRRPELVQSIKQARRAVRPGIDDHPVPSAR